MGIVLSTVISKLAKLKVQSEILLAGLILLVVMLLVLPIPTFLLDILISFNLASALAILLVTINVPSSIKLSSFPTILLLATLFRLSLNVATARLILLNADAGEMVLAFGQTLILGNVFVGIVIFLLLMLINFLVITKGSERIAEVSARFILDAMPGKQMGIDADLRSGLMDLEKARAKREELSIESKFFGAMDGAMKFVKGDAIAGIIIFIINIVAGLIIGLLQGLSIDEALEVYVILSVGDGLISIIPALLLSIASSLLVTRSDNGQNLSKTMSQELLIHKKAFLIAAIFLLFLALLPGLPHLCLLLMAVVLACLGLVPKNQLKKAAPKASVVPICIEVSENLAPFVSNKSDFFNLIKNLINNLEDEIGLVFPSILVRQKSRPFKKRICFVDQ